MESARGALTDLALQELRLIRPKNMRSDPGGEYDRSPPSGLRQIPADPLPQPLSATLPIPTAPAGFRACDSQIGAGERLRATQLTTLTC